MAPKSWSAQHYDHNARHTRTHNLLLHVTIASRLDSINPVYGHDVLRHLPTVATFRGVGVTGGEMESLIVHHPSFTSRVRDVEENLLNSEREPDIMAQSETCIKGFDV